ncbi:hypothetical protein GCM10007387_05900 [Pseudoduganella albidiflava]|uniref:Uncharacterized protein n=1 Tax=Pseudoduganella albidiflava TaxID=321983 RepID=A0AA87XNP0_9BURK|nr:hypothetical protein GCM10007387_05900 [Pseudoduganella albidiflava]
MGIPVAATLGLVAGKARSDQPDSAPTNRIRASHSGNRPYSTVTDFARFRGLSTSVPRASAV